MYGQALKKPCDALPNFECSLGQSNPKPKQNKDVSYDHDTTRHGHDDQR